MTATEILQNEDKEVIVNFDSGREEATICQKYIVRLNSSTSIEIMEQLSHPVRPMAWVKLKAGDTTVQIGIDRINLKKL